MSQSDLGIVLMWSTLRTGMRLVSGGILPAPKLRGLLNTKPLHDHLEESMACVNGEITGINANIQRGKIKAISLVTTSYSTGQSVVWIQGKDIEPWIRPQRVTILGIRK